MKYGRTNLIIEIEFTKKATSKISDKWRKSIAIYIKTRDKQLLHNQRERSFRDVSSIVRFILFEFNFFSFVLSIYSLSKDYILTPYFRTDKIYISNTLV